MSREVFEYFYEPEELEPFYSILLNTPLIHRQRPKLDDSKTNVSQTEEPVAAVPPVESDDGRASTQEQTNPESAISTNVSSDVVNEQSAPEKAATPSTTPAEEDSTPKPDLDSENDETETIDTSQTRVREILSVHALGQFLYCKRSAILAAELGDQTDHDESLPRLTYLPNFDRERIEEMLSEQIGLFCFAVVLAICMLVLAAIGFRNQNRVLFLLSLFGYIGSAAWCPMLLLTIGQLTYRRRAAIKAEAREPDPEILDIQAVNWWSMLKAGFEPANYLQPMLHPELPLDGCPWRVLERGSQRIPVIRSGAKSLGFAKGDLYPKHQIRLAAYALLLESFGDTSVPYGLVFPSKSPIGLALPITDELKDKTTKTLAQFDQVIKQSQQNEVEPRAPENRNLCKDCRYGSPEPIEQEAIDAQRTSGNALLVLESKTGRTYHCPCGDRFGSAPPHGTSLKLGLTASLQ